MEARIISPTLAEFLNVPYFTKLNEQDIVLALWRYIETHRLLIDDRIIALDKRIGSVVHPEVYWGEVSESPLESSIVMVSIARMHQDPDFIRRDVDRRLKKLREKQAARVISRFLLTARKK